jgi:thiol-disulfide isomerase/thioredoxin
MTGASFLRRHTMTMKKNRRVLGCAFVLILGLAVAASAQNAPRPQPPEVKDLTAAFRIQDPAARLKELERIKAAFPASQYLAMIEQNILGAKIELADSLDVILALQKDLLAKGKGPDRLQNPLMAADQILSHPKAKSFDKAKVLAAILRLREEAVKAAGEPDTSLGVPADQQKEFKAFFINGFQILMAEAQLTAGDTAKAQTALDVYIKDGGMPDAAYFYTLAGIQEKTNKPKEAYEAYLTAAADKYEDAAAKAKALYAKLNGKADGFEAALEAKLRELPYHPEPFKAPAGWKGKTALAEIFTGSECPPCVAADLGFDGLIEAYPASALAVLEYHLPIPRPDPMINAAAQKRLEYYGVNSTPSTFFDGEAKLGGGGSRGMAGSKFKAYKAEIDPRIAAAPGLVLTAKAVRTGDVIKVECLFDKSIPGAEINVVLAQASEKYAGSNGIVFHKMVVRDLAVLPAGAKSASFDLAASEKAADEYLTNFEKTNTRFQGYKFPERHAKINRQGLRIVVFAQAKDTKKVLNAAVVEVK